jgi:hypothetical protein
MVSKLDVIYVIGFMEKGAINIGEIKWFGDKNNWRMFMNSWRGVHETCIQQIFINELFIVVCVNIIIVECYTSNIFQFLFKWLFVNFPLKLAKKGIYFDWKCETHVGVVFVKHLFFLKVLHWDLLSGMGCAKIVKLG